MANRVVIDPVHTFKVSKPGVNVLTANAQNLLVGGAFETMGVYATGVINPTAGYYFGYPTGFQGETNYVYRTVLPNPTSSIPWVICQRINSSTVSVSNFTDRNYKHYRSINDESIPTYIDWREGKADHFTYSFTPSSIEFRAPSLFTVRYSAFYAKAGDNIYAAADVTPNPINWADRSTPSTGVSSTSEYVTGLSDNVAIVLRIHSNQVGVSNNAYTVQAQTYNASTTIGYGTFTLQPGQNNIYVEMKNNDNLRFMISSTDNVDRSVVLNVYNATIAESEVLLDTVTLRVNFIDNVPNALNWTNVSGDTTAQTNSQTVTGINVPVQLRVDFSPAYTGYFGLNTTSPSVNINNGTTNATSFWVNNNQSYYMSFTPASTYNGTVTIRNATVGNTSLDTFTVNVTAAPPQIRGDWGSMVGTSYTMTIGESGTAKGVSNSVTIANLPAAHTLRMTIANNPPPGGMQMFVIRGGSSIFAINLTGTTKTGTYAVQNGDVVRFEASRTGTNFYMYSTNLVLTDVTAGNIVIDEVPVSLMQEVMGV